ncbi:MAG: SapC family protein [Alphaproteobacteria bacterium]
MAKKKDDAQAGAGDAAESALPVFYRRPMPLDPGRHGAMSLKRMTNFSFARKTNSVPLNGVEFPFAMRHYPIVFTAGDQPNPVAVLGVRADKNLFVTEWGGWEDGLYVPAYVRRYPFIFMEEGGSDRLILCIDEATDLLTTDSKRPLFADGKPTDVVTHALDFCTEFQAQHAATAEFGRALAAHDLLIPNRADVSLISGEKLSLGGFRIIDESRFHALPDDVFLDWRKRGWLHLVYCHLMSSINWGRLADLTDKAEA